MKKTTQFFESPTPVCLVATSVTDDETNGYLAENGTVTPKMDQLSYPFRKPLLIDEIRFTLLGFGFGDGSNLGALVYVRLSLGQMYLMRDPVPIASLAPMMSIEDEQYVGGPGLGIASVSHYRWRLPQPLYVEAGQYILPVFSWPRREFVFAAPISGVIQPYISFCGRTVPPNRPRPKVIPVPYVAPFVTDTMPPGNYVQSNEKHLFNPFDKPIQIQRLTARTWVQNSAGADGQASLQAGITASPVAPTNMTVRINDSWGGKVVNDYTGPGDVMDLQRTSWTFDTEMPAKGMFLVQVWNLNEQGFPGNETLHIAMIGTREEKL